MKPKKNRMIENVLKSQIAQLNKEKIFWESKEHNEADMTDMTVELNDSVFKSQANNIFYINNNRRLSEALSSYNIQSTNGALDQYFRNELSMRPEEVISKFGKEENIAKPQKLSTFKPLPDGDKGTNENYDFPRDLS